MATYELAVPPLDEQRSINAFLAHETAKIDALIAKKERMIDLLHEQLLSIINDAVTSGVKTNVPMKDTDIEWAPKIPVSWDVLPLKRLLTRCDYGISDSLIGGGKIPILTMSHIQDGEVEVPSKGSVDSVPDRLLLDQNDLLFNRTNSRDLVGKVGLFRGDRKDKVSFASYLVRMTANVRTSAHFLNYALNSVGCLSFVRSLAILSVNQANLNPTRYGQINLPIPSLQEQLAIVKILDDRRVHVRRLISDIELAIARLTELRTVLISMAVTGKIDVRGEAV